jgi:hypothetical protein
MGGYGSGRYRTRNVGAVTAMPRLDMRALRRAGLVQPGAVVTGTLSWTRRGVTAGQATVRVDLAKGDAGVLMVAFALNGEARRQDVAVISRPMPYGGRRYFFTCPETESPCEVLALVGDRFASRQAHRLAYRSQSEDGLGRLHRRVDALGSQLWPDGRGRPRGQKRQRLTEAWIEASIQLEGRLKAALGAIAAAEAGQDRPPEAFGLGRRQWPTATASRPRQGDQRGR